MDQKKDKEIIKAIAITSHTAIIVSIILVSALFSLVTYLFVQPAPKSNTILTTIQVTQKTSGRSNSAERTIPADAWKAPDTNSIPPGKDGEMIRYGRELITSTSKYLGPQGSVAHLTNGMNCQNCHLNAGTKLFSNNFAGFIADYPKFSDRSGKVEPAAKRIAECFERSLNGTVPDTNQREIQAMLAYMKWVGKDVKKGQKLFGPAVEKLAFMDHPADPDKGKIVFTAKCQSCHSKNGEGVLATDGTTYTYPPLWGAHSYNDGAGMYRLIKFAGFVKNNMPLGATYQNPQLTDEEAWNVAAFVNSQPRPHKDQRDDYPDLSKKPIDLPFGPYADTFTGKRHKYGTFGPITASQKTTHK